MTRLAQLDAQILAAKEAFDVVLRDVPRTFWVQRSARWRIFLRDIAPLVAEREALLGDVWIPDIAANYDPLRDGIRQWKRP